MDALPTVHLDLPLEGMTCAACAARIEKNLNKLEGVEAIVRKPVEPKVLLEKIKEIFLRAS